MTEQAYDPLDGSDKYRVTRELGRGGMGEVFLGEHIALGTEVVLKFLHLELSNKTGLVDRMRLEAQACAKLNHPNIVRVTDFDRTPKGRPFFVMEYLPGRPLTDEVEARGGWLPVAEAVDVTRQALAGLSYAHGKGLVHRDMKLDNLFVVDPAHAGGKMAVKILDFGVAKVLDGGSDDGPAPLMVPTGTGVVVGTPRFFAPEQARGKKLDHRADIYSMGLVLYSLLAGRGPFDEARNITEMAKAHVLTVPHPPSAFAQQPIPPGVDQAVLRAVAKKPEDRFQSADEFSAALAAALQGQGQAGTQAMPQAGAYAQAGQPAPAGGYSQHGHGQTGQGGAVQAHTGHGYPQQGQQGYPQQGQPGYPQQGQQTGGPQGSPSAGAYDQAPASQVAPADQSGASTAQGGGAYPPTTALPDARPSMASVTGLGPAGVSGSTPGTPSPVAPKRYSGAFAAMVVVIAALAGAVAALLVLRLT